MRPRTSTVARTVLRTRSTRTMAPLRRTTTLFMIVYPAHRCIRCLCLILDLNSAASALQVRNSRLVVVSSVPVGTIEVLTAQMRQSVIPARKAGTQTKPANLFAWHVQRGGTKRNRGNRNV